MLPADRMWGHSGSASPATVCLSSPALSGWKSPSHTAACMCVCVCAFGGFQLEQLLVGQDCTAASSWFSWFKIVCGPVFVVVTRLSLQAGHITILFSFGKGGGDPGVTTACRKTWTELLWHHCMSFSCNFVDPGNSHLEPHGAELQKASGSQHSWDSLQTNHSSDLEQEQSFQLISQWTIHNHLQFIHSSNIDRH